MCYTDLVTCCRTQDSNGAGAFGSYQFPNGSYVISHGNANTNVFSRSRNKQAVVLHRGINASKPSGIFTCNIPDVNINNQKIYFGIYASEEGTPLSLYISTRMILSNNLCKLSRNMLYCIFYRVYYIY